MDTIALILSANSWSALKDLNLHACALVSKTNVSAVPPKAGIVSFLLVFVPDGFAQYIGLETRYSRLGIEDHWEETSCR